MDKIFKQDDELGKSRNHYCKTHTLSETVLQYTHALEQLDFTDCPENFTKAFQNHRKAWLAILPITNKNETLRGEMHQLFKEIENGADGETFKKLVAEIWRTWDEVEKARKN